MAEPFMMALGYGAIKGLGALGKWWGRKRHKPPTFGKTDYGQYLAKMAEQGKYSPRARMNIMSRAGRTGGNIAQSTRAEARGYLTSQGFGDSIAGAGLLARPGLEHGRRMTGMARDIETEQEMSKQAAHREYAQRATEWSAMRQGQKAQAETELWGGLTGAATTGYGTYLGARAAEEADVPYPMDPTTARAYGMERYYGRKDQTMPDFSTMNERDIYTWIYQQPDRDEAAWYLINIGVLPSANATGKSGGGAGLGAKYGRGGWY